MGYRSIHHRAHVTEEMDYSLDGSLSEHGSVVLEGYGHRLRGGKLNTGKPVMWNTSQCPQCYNSQLQKYTTT